MKDIEALRTGRINELWATLAVLTKNHGFPTKEEMLEKINDFGIKSLSEDNYSDDFHFLCC